jgi:aspartate kinase
MSSAPSAPACEGPGIWLWNRRIPRPAIRAFPPVFLKGSPLSPASQGPVASMARIVMKFGGTSVADIARIRNVARHVKR